MSIEPDFGKSRCAAQGGTAALSEPGEKGPLFGSGGGPAPATPGSLNDATLDLKTFEVRYGTLPWQTVDRAGFAAWLANVQRNGSGSVRGYRLEL